MNNTELVRELIDIDLESKIDELRINAFMMTTPENLDLYYKAVSKYFKQRFDRRLEASYYINGD